MSDLEQLIACKIAQTGPVNLAEYMSMCLLHPDYGYYAQNDPFGRDFITAPEVSQMFGELIGLALAQTWVNQGAPSTACLVELGPGRGTLMQDILRATSGVAGFHEAMSVHFVEASPTLRKIQASHVPNAVWYRDFQDIAQSSCDPLFLVANEFFDALPIRQFVKTGTAWRERVIDRDDDKFFFRLSGCVEIESLVHRLDDVEEGGLVEVSAVSQDIMAQIGEKIAQTGGAALIIDYGDWRSLGDTLQGVERNEYISPLAKVGQVDLTAHVDFEALAHAAQPAKFTRVTPQGVFLERLGLAARTQALARNLQGQSLDAHLAAHRRLAHPDEMGNLFKVLGLYREGQQPPVGLNA